MTTLKVFFWICLFLVFYTYIGYGILLWLLVCIKRLFKGKPQKDALTIRGGTARSNINDLCLQ